MTRATRTVRPQSPETATEAASETAAAEADADAATDSAAEAGEKTTADTLRAAENALKIVVVGGFGVGKTTMVRSVSEIRPLHTEETMSPAGLTLDDPSRISSRKSATTVAFDFGRITIDERAVLYLFGAPGQERFWFLWERMLSGTIGAVVLVDTRRLPEAWYALDRLEHHGVPYIVAVNDFGGPFYTDAQIRHALALDADVPMVEFDARDHSSSKFVLIALVEHLYDLSLHRQG
ncbi:ATP/GTP-binding protein [Streptomyces sp. NPDC020875]|uniref:GTP-binding protein n=1 Tax=Streptomyces sp. NPDC020875 TaxID=3154898 RepID=UPI0033DCEAB6